MRTRGADPRGAAAFAELYERHRDTVMAQAYKITDNRDRAEDLAEEAFARVLRALLGGHGPQTSVLGYLLVTLRSEAARSGAIERSTVAVAPETIQEMSHEVTPDFTEALSERDQVSAAFAQLSEDARRVLWFVDVEQLPLEEVSERLGVKLGALRVQLHRARKRLGTAYLQQYVESGDPECRPSSQQLARLARGELGKRARQRVDEHVRGCRSCTEQLARLESLQRQLRNWVGPLFLGGGAGAALAESGGGSAAAAPGEPAAFPGDHAVTPATVGGRILGAVGLVVTIAGLVWVLWQPDQQGPLPTPGTPPAEEQGPQQDGSAPTEGAARAGEAPRETQQEESGPEPRAPRANGDPAPPERERVDGDDATRHWKLRK